MTPRSVPRRQARRPLEPDDDDGDDSEGPICDFCGGPHLLEDCPETAEIQKSVEGLKRKHNLVIDGRKLTMRTQPVSADVFVRKKMWDKTKRPTSGEERQAFIKEATGFVLAKTNKLSVSSHKEGDDGSLKHIYRLTSQLTQLKNQLINCDMIDVFTIVDPYDVRNSPEIRPVTCDLFTDYVRLHPDVVANSCGWYNRWVSDPYIAENMEYSCRMFESNTESDLWTKSLEKYNEYPEMQRGGPLILTIVLRRIQDVSEDAIENIKGRIRALNVKKDPGENIDYFVSLILSSCQALLSASTKDRSFVPDDFPCTILKIFQTSSVPEFNEAFKEEERVARRQADMFGGLPVWPTVQHTTNLASSMYSRLKNKGDWVADVKQKKNVYPGFKDTKPPSSRPKRTCWNCGEDHMLNDCPKPRDEARIKKAVEKFRAENPRRNNRRGPKHKNGPDGRPLVKNKKGVYVLDQKAV